MPPKTPCHARILTFFFHSQGKTAPRLLNDLYHYDPFHQRGAFNVLLDIPKYEDGQMVVDPTSSSNGCHHTWTLDHDHTNIPSVSPDSATPPHCWVVVHCINCRSQLAIVLSFPSKSAKYSCPTSGSPLHHFLHQPLASKSLLAVQDPAPSTGWREVQEFTCTSPTCAVRLQVVFQPPRLIPTWVRLLIDPELIRDRAERAIASDPERFEGHDAPSGAEVLSNLRAYLLNGLKSSDRKVIRGNNKRWLLSLGEPCAELLTYLGFEKTV